MIRNNDGEFKSNLNVRLNTLYVLPVYYLNFLAVNVNYMDPVPISHPQAATLCKAATNRLQRG